jgi:hypothetical protein
MNLLPSTVFSSFLKALSDTYDQCKVLGISRRHLKHAELMEILTRLQSNFPNLFTIKEVGTSAEGRSINLVTVGSGKTKILSWSQMHGDESTATRALLDMLNIIGSHHAESYVQTILERTSLLLLPMINPDGAERFERRNAQGLDINRDAVALQTPEGRILRAVRDEVEPEFGFNLHDQDTHFAVGRTNRIAAIALLAPPYDEAKNTNEVRRRATHLAAFLAQVLAHYIPGHVSRYDDRFDPRAYGDRMQQLGTSTVLLESGGWYDDPEKEYLRKLNAMGLLAACYGIATGTYLQSDLDAYEALPENNENVFDILIRNALYRPRDGADAIEVDVGVNIVEQWNGLTDEWTRTAQVMDVGDLTPYSAFRTIDAERRMLAISSFTIGAAIPIEKLESDALFRA